MGVMSRRRIAEDNARRKAEAEQAKAEEAKKKPAPKPAAKEAKDAK